MSQGIRWPEGGYKAAGVRRTQGRHINSFCKLFALDTNNHKISHQAAQALGIETLKIISIANGIREGPSLEAKALGVRAILRSLTAKTKYKVNSIFHLGNMNSFWGPPLTRNFT
jgi:hypothetical protein